MEGRRADVVVVGGGIIGLATAHALQGRLDGASVVVLEKESEVGTHQTGHNSGVIHAGIYYQPGSLKARLAVLGAASMAAFCADHGVAHDRCGKLVVATDEDGRRRLSDLGARAAANGVEVAELEPAAAAELEPHVSCVAALHVPSTGRADFGAVARVLADRVEGAGGTVRTGVSFASARATASGWSVRTEDGPMSAGFLVGCAGLHSDRVALGSGADPGARILPFRGEYLDVVGPSADLVRGLVYPVPDPALPFLGVHLTRGLDGRVHAGPNAVLALAREGYRWSDASLRDLASTVAWPGTLRMARRWWRAGLDEALRSVSTSRFADSARVLVPDLDPADLSRSGAGVRAQAVDVHGNLLDDFHLVEGERSLHVVNAPSPAATASLEIGGLVADRVAGRITRD